MKQTGEAGVPANKQYSASTPVQKTGYTIRAAIGRLRKIQMQPSKKIPAAILLQLTPFVGFGLFLSIVFTLHGGAAVNFTLFYAYLGWFFSVACGWYAAKQKETRYKKSVKASLVLLVLSPIPLLNAVLSVASICIILSILLREDWNGTCDGYDWVIFFTQVCWAGSSFFLLVMLGGVYA